jgi:PAS domain S-box-containing protein
MISRWVTEWLVALGSIPAALIISLFSVWVLVGLFYYLNRFTRRGYFNLWTCAWVFYALWLTLQLQPREKEDALLNILRYACLSASAIYLLWGSFVFRQLRVRLWWIGLSFGLLLVWDAVVVVVLRNPLAGAISVFWLAGIGSLAAGLSFLQAARQRRHFGSGLVVTGFFIWGICLAAFPYLQKNEQWAIMGFVGSAATQLFIAVSMIILVLEETRDSKDSALHEIQAHQEAELAWQQKFRTLFEHASDGIVVASADNLQILNLNPKAERLLGLSAAKAHNHRLSSFFPTSVDKEQPPEGGAAWMTWLGKQQRLHLQSYDGGMVPVSMQGLPIPHNGQPAYQFFVQELTGWARMDRQLRQAEKLASLGRMISGIAHELNNPLAVVKGYLELILARHELTEATRTDLLKVVQESNRAAKLVNKFLTFTREETQQREPVNLNELIRHLIDLRQFEFRHAEVELELDLQPDLPATQANADQMQQILVNLVTNALQAMQPLPPPHRLTLRTTRNNKLILVAVEDNGPGIPDQLGNKIFEPFFTTKGAGTGTGLGLSISHRLMAEHDGRLYYEKSPANGARFVLELPWVEVLPGKTTAPSKDEASSEPNREDILPANILVVDDETGIAELLGESLVLLGYSSTLCSFAPKALELIENHDYDLVISDLRMPVMDGRQLYQLAIQKKPALKNRFVFLTGDIVNEDAQSFLQATGNIYMGKPFHLSKVEQVIAQVLQEQAAKSPGPMAVPMAKPA